jgi:hypothetical protein
MTGKAQRWLPLLCLVSCAKLIGADFDKAHHDGPGEGGQSVTGSGGTVAQDSDTGGAEAASSGAVPMPTAGGLGAGGIDDSSVAHEGGNETRGQGASGGDSGAGAPSAGVPGAGAPGAGSDCSGTERFVDVADLPPTLVGGQADVLAAGLALLPDHPGCVAALIGINTLVSVGCSTSVGEELRFGPWEQTESAYKVQSLLESGVGTSFAALSEVPAWGRTRLPLEARSTEPDELLTLIVPRSNAPALAARLSISSSVFANGAPRAPTGTPAAVFGRYGKLIGFCDLGECLRPQSCTSLSTLVASSDALHTYYARRGVLFADATGEGQADATVVNWNGVSLRQSLKNGLGAPFAWSPTWAQYARQLQVADVNSDGLADLVTVQNQRVDVQLSSGLEFGKNSTWIDAPFYGVGGTLFGDVDDDGAADAAIVEDGNVIVRRSTGAEFGVAEVWAQEVPPSFEAAWLQDVTADGHADMVILSSGVLQVSISTGTGFADATPWLSDAQVAPTSLYLADVTGDGASDVIALEAGKLRVWESDLTRFSSAADGWTMVPPIGQRANYFADIDGDGAADSIALDFSQIIVSFSSGSDFSGPLLWFNGAYWGGL